MNQAVAKTQELQARKKPDTKGQQMAVQTPMDLLQAAVANNVDAGQLEKLMDLQERWEGNQARKAFESAMAGFQADCPAVHKGRQADRYTYADLDQIMAAVRPVMERHGLSVRFSTRISDTGMLTALCKVSHVDGHSEDSEFSCPVDQNLRVNDAQKQASANTYARRYALMNALNIVVTDEDDDGQAAGTAVEGATDEQLAVIQEYADAEAIPAPTLEWLEKRKWKLSEPQAAKLIAKLKESES